MSPSFMLLHFSVLKRLTIKSCICLYSRVTFKNQTIYKENPTKLKMRFLQIFRIYYCLLTKRIVNIRTCFQFQIFMLIKFQQAINLKINLIVILQSATTPQHKICMCAKTSCTKSDDLEGTKDE